MLIFAPNKHVQLRVEGMICRLCVCAEFVMACCETPSLHQKIAATPIWTLHFRPRYNFDGISRNCSALLHCDEDTERRKGRRKGGQREEFRGRKRDEARKRKRKEVSYSRSDIVDSWEEVICRKLRWCQNEKSWPQVQPITHYIWSMFPPWNVGMHRKQERQLDK